MVEFKRNIIKYEMRLSFAIRGGSLHSCHLHPNTHTQDFRARSPSIFDTTLLHLSIEASKKLSYLILLDRLQRQILAFEKIGEIQRRMDEPCSIIMHKWSF